MPGQDRPEGQEEEEVIRVPTELYIGAKLIRGRPMDECTFLDTFRGKTCEDGTPSREGYLVIYPDGYKSWSPKEVFETAYREVTEGERALI